MERPKCIEALDSSINSHTMDSYQLFLNIVPAHCKSYVYCIATTHINNES